MSTKLSSLSIFLFIGSLALHAQSIEVDTILDWTDVLTTIEEKDHQYGTEGVLIVLDIDNTLITSQTDLGGDIWYQWQRGKLQTKPTEDQKIKKCLFEDVIGLLYELGTMELVDPKIPGYIESWQNDGFTVFALTSRNPKYRTPTERELLKQGIDFSVSPLLDGTGNMPMYSYQLERGMSYMNGIMMTTGMNKGLMLQHILQRTGQSYSAIVLVDDSGHNIDNIYEAWKDSAIDMHLFYYQEVEHTRRMENGGLVVTEEQAAKMDSDWKALNETLLKIFPGRDISKGCVDPE